MTADQEDDSIPLSYAEAEGSGRVVCCGAGVSLWQILLQKYFDHPSAKH
jgi:hypothetical protein